MIKEYDPYVDHPTWQECKGCELGNNWTACEPCWTRKAEECMSNHPFPQEV